MKKNNISLIETQSPQRFELEELLNFFKNENYDEAEKLAISLIENFEKHPFAWKVLGALLYKTGRISESLIACEKSVQLDPNNAEAHNNLAISLQKLGRFHDAEVYFKQAIALNNNYSEPHNNLGNNFHQQGQYEEAVKSFIKAISLNKNNAQAHFNLGNSLQKINRMDEAESAYKKAIFLKSDYLLAHNNLGVLLKERGKLEDAESYFAMAIQLKPEFAEFHNNIGNVFKRLGKLDRAEEALRNSIKLEPNNIQTIFNLSTLLNYMNRNSQAIKLLEDNLNKFSGNFALMARVELAISSFLNDDLIASKKYLSASSELEKMVDLKLKNYKVYWNYLNKIIYKNNPQTEFKKKLNTNKEIYVIGESHSLVSHGLKIKISNVNFICKAILIKGVKQWDLGNSRNNHFKFKFESLFAELKKSSRVLLAIGEIDCRLDSGIMNHMRKFPNKNINDLINNTVSNYLDYVENINSKYNHTILIQGIPCPNINTSNVSKKDLLELIKLIKDFNNALRATSIKKRFGFLDIYSLTDRGDGYSNKKWHIDQYHLHSNGILEAWKIYDLN